MGGESSVLPEVGGWPALTRTRLADRPSRAADHQAESRALVELCGNSARSSDDLLALLTERLVELCRAGSAIVVLFERDDGEATLRRCRAAAGALAGRDGEIEAGWVLPMDHAATGADEILAFSAADHVAATKAQPGAPVFDALAAPLAMNGACAGLAWVFSHHGDRRFDAEDGRLLAATTRVAATALGALVSRADLRASERRFQAMLTCAGPCAFWGTTDGAVLEAPGWEALTGQTPSEYRGWGWMDAVHPEDHQRAGASRTLALASGQPAHLDFRVRGRDGKWRWVSAYTAPVRDEPGAIVEWIGAITDVQELRTTKAALAETEIFHRLAAEAGRTGSWYMHLATSEFVLSPITAELFGLPPAQTGWPPEGWFPFVVPEDRDPLRSAVRQAIDTGSSFEVEFRIRRADGAERWLYSRGGVALGPAGEPVRVQGITVDMTESKTAQARRLAIPELADQIRDCVDPADIAATAARFIGETLGAARTGFGVLNPVTGAITLQRCWTPSNPTRAAADVSFTSYARRRKELESGEPVVVACDDEPGAGIVVCRPLTAEGGPMWLLYVEASSPGDWAGHDLAFIREAAERTRGAIDRRRVERELRKLATELEREVETRTADWSRLWRNSRDLLLVMNREGVFRAANPAWTAILGWSSEAVVGRNFTDFLHPGDHVAARASLVGGGDEVTPGFETRCRHRDGGYRWVSWVAALEGNLVYATGRHISAEKEAAAALARTQARSRTFFETSYQYRALVSLEGILLDVNTTALKSAATARDDVLGKPLWETPWFTQTDGVPEAVREAVASAAAGETRREDIYLKLPALGWRWLDFTLRPLVDALGGTLGVVLEAVDITDRRHAEMALRQSQKLEAIGQLTGGVAHDFNNLLTPIIGGLDLLHRRAVGGDRDRRLIEGALQSAERAKVLVQRLLAFARRQPLQTRPVDVASLVRGIADLVASTSGPRIRVLTDAPDGLPLARADDNQLEMAILNLSVNARDAMPDGGSLKLSVITETVGAGNRSELAPGDYVRLSVADTGTGMDEGTLARAVEPFFSTKGHGRGTGLGLSMVHGLASQLGGGLVITSAPDSGTTVDLWLPVSGDEADHVAATRSTPFHGVSGPAGAALLVDDESLARASTAAMLSEMGYDVIQASSGEEALSALFSGVPFDLLITDHLMPGMSGAELAETFREHWPMTPVLIITGYADTLPPGLPHLTKPFRRADLAASLAALQASLAVP
jgi:PAS domain S-box-containing protein